MANMTVSRLSGIILTALILTIMPMSLMGPVVVPTVLPGPGIAQAGDILPDGCLGNLTDDQVVVYYFHRKFKCGSCEVVETTLQEALEAFYGPLFKDGRLAMCVVNIDDPANREFLDRFELLSTSLVVVKKKHGAVAQFKHLDNVWDVSEDSEAISDILKTEISLYLSES
jgi:hypothetical protein